MLQLLRWMGKEVGRKAERLGVDWLAHVRLIALTSLAVRPAVLRPFGHALGISISIRIRVCGALTQDSEAIIYGYHQYLSIAGQHRSVVGIAAVPLI